MSQSTPTILIVHGAWHHPAYFQSLIKALHERKYDISCPRLPTCNNAVPLNKTLEDDVKLIHDTATELADEGKEIVALMHSYGGIVGTDALYDLSFQSRTKSGLKGGVRRLLYMCAFVPQGGQSLAGIFGGGLPPWLQPKVVFFSEVSARSILTALRTTASFISMILRCTSITTWRPRMQRTSLPSWWYIQPPRNGPM